MHQMANTFQRRIQGKGPPPLPSPSPAPPPQPLPRPPLPSPSPVPPLPRDLSEVLDTPLHSPYLHLEALKVQNSLYDNYQLPPSPPPKKVTSGNETGVDPSSFIMLFFKLTSFLLSALSCKKERGLYQNKVNLSLT